MSNSEITVHTRDRVAAKWVARGDNPTLRRIGLLLLLGGAYVICSAVQAAPSDPDPAVNQSMDRLRSTEHKEIDEGVDGLVSLGERAVPALTDCLQEQSIRYGCGEALSRMPPHLSARVLETAIDSKELSTRENRIFRAFLIGALGRLKSDDTVPFLERLHATEKDELMQLSIAWALENVTGQDYGPAHDPWLQGR